ncbi:MAG: TRAP transporter small permease, partial [Limisphaerales bacterium]
MGSSAPVEKQPAVSETRAPFRWWHCLENALLIASLLLLILLPLTERILRAFFDSGIQGEADFVLHFTLIVSMVGGSVAAREQRLLGISTFSQFLKGRWKSWAHFSSHTWGGGVTFLMAMAAWQFVQDEKGAGNEIAYGVARWWIQMVLPLGFASIALRLVWHAGPHWKYRILSAAGILAMGMLVSRQGLDPEQWKRRRYHARHPG